MRGVAKKYVKMNCFFMETDNLKCVCGGRGRGSDVVLINAVTKLRHEACGCFETTASVFINALNFLSSKIRKKENTRNQKILHVRKNINQYDIIKRFVKILF